MNHRGESIGCGCKKWGFFGDYAFSGDLSVGDRIFEDMMHYTMVKPRLTGGASINRRAQERWHIRALAAVFLRDYRARLG